jgi:hypothetical protein
MVKYDIVELKKERRRKLEALGVLANTYETD